MSTTDNLALERWVRESETGEHDPLCELRVPARDCVGCLLIALLTDASRTDPGDFRQQARAKLIEIVDDALMGLEDLGLGSSNDT
jgi:hypothetical protein